MVLPLQYLKKKEQISFDKSKDNFINNDKKKNRQNK